MTHLTWSIQEHTIVLFEITEHPRTTVEKTLLSMVDDL